MSVKKQLSKLIDYTLDILLIIVVSLLLFNMFSGYSVMVGLGDSMNPTINDCSITFNEKVDSVDEVEENDIIGYTSDTGLEIKHRVIIKEDSFDRDSGQIRYINGHIFISETPETFKNSDFERDLSDIGVSYLNTEEFVAFRVDESTIQDVEGEPVFITQGDGNIQDGDSIYELSQPDRELVSMDKVNESVITHSEPFYSNCDFFTNIIQQLYTHF